MLDANADADADDKKKKTCTFNSKLWVTPTSLPRTYVVLCAEVVALAVLGRYGTILKGKMVSPRICHF